MKKQLIIVTTILLMAACNSREEKSVTSTTEEALLTETSSELIRRGEYLVTIGACHDCHSPKVMTEMGPEPDASRLLSGHPHNEPVPDIPDDSKEWVLFSMDLTTFVGPWGVSYAANLTPDDTGIGNWSYEQFETAIRKGKSKGLETNRDLLPPMPWQMYRNFTDEDLRAIFAYLKSLKPVNNLVPQPIPPHKLEAMAR